MRGRVLVLNATFEPINVCTVRRAAVLLLKDKAEIVERASWELRSETMTLPRPIVIRLVSYVRVPRDTHRRKITRRAVFARDGWTCQYCGSRSNLTVDHVVPRSKGGASTWDNIVASCAPCNRRKGDRLPRQAGMRLIREPASPSAHIFIHVASPTIPAAWRQYLPAGRLSVPERTRGRPRPDAPRSRTDWTRACFGLLRRWDQPRLRDRRCPGLDSAKRIQPSDLAAGHLQGPARTVTQRRTTSFLWSGYLSRPGRRTKGGGRGLRRHALRRAVRPVRGAEDTHPVTPGDVRAL